MMVYYFRPLLSRPDEESFDSIILETASRHQVSPYLVKAVIKQESNFDPLARGAAGERGLMQIMGGAVKDWEQANDRRVLHSGMLYSPRLNIEIGTWYLGRGLRRWSEYRDVQAIALAEYNAGPSRARRWAPSDPQEEFLPRVEFASTRNYIENVLRYKAEYVSGKAILQNQ